MQFGINDREAATILAALRDWQARLAGDNRQSLFIDLHTVVATSGGAFAALSLGETRQLIDRLRNKELPNG